MVWEASWPTSAVLARLSEDGQARCRRLRSTLEAAFRVRNDSPVTRWVERTWLASRRRQLRRRSAQELELARAVFARLRELEQRGLPDAGGSGEQALRICMPDHGSASAVEIMTIHKAKGLGVRHGRVAGAGSAHPPAAAINCC